MARKGECRKCVFDWVSEIKLRCETCARTIISLNSVNPTSSLLRLLLRSDQLSGKAKADALEGAEQ